MKCVLCVMIITAYNEQEILLRLSIQVITLSGYVEYDRGREIRPIRSIPVV